MLYALFAILFISWSHRSMIVIVGWMFLLLLFLIQSATRMRFPSLDLISNGWSFFWVASVQKHVQAPAALWLFNRKAEKTIIGLCCVCINSDDEVQLVKDLHELSVGYLHSCSFSFNSVYVWSVREWKISVLISRGMRKTDTLPHVICFIHTLVICFEVLTNWQTDYTTINSFFTLNKQS